jgi:hypothetical protein
MNDLNKPTDLESYKSWLAEQSHIAIDRRLENYYTRETFIIKQQFETSNFWQEFLKNLDEYDINYYRNSKGYDLFLKMNNRIIQPEINIKPYNSVIDKTYRKNVIENRDFPKEPPEGWIYPDNLFLKINDIIRTSVIVKYMDGAKFLVNELTNLGDKYHKKIEPSYEARWEGYYAVHVSVPHTVKIANINLDATNEYQIIIEIQIITQIQDIIKKLLHKYYEDKRSQVMNDPSLKDSWKWDSSCDEFSTNYLGHILHYVEGAIVEIRERQIREVKK